MFDILKVVFLIRRRRILKSIEDLLKFRNMYLNLKFFGQIYCSLSYFYVTFMNKFSRYVTNVINVTVYPEKC